MVSKRKIATTAATFGAAMTAMCAAPELQADILDLTWEGGNATWTNPYFNGYDTTPQTNDIDQVENATSLNVNDFNQWNDTFGRTVNVGGGRNILSATLVALGQSLDPNTFVGLGNSLSVGVIGGISQGTGTSYLGFRSVNGNVGWFKMEFTAAGPIVYSDGEYATAGETVVVGGTAGGGFCPPASFSTFRGTVLNATLSDFVDSDDVRARYQPGFVLNSAEAPVWLIFDANCPAAIDISVEANAGTPGLTYTVEAWDWGTSSYVVVGTQGTSFNVDATSVFPIGAANINANGDVRSRVGWRKTGLTINFPWEVRIDQVGWNQ